ncbi:peptidase S53 [Duganella sp. FT50W]|uniref:Peptidase S53 n=1 Tax=Duganella lactea TaxID=2692173 RepID=A0A6L8MD89_9BURK|nr:S53 family peptidase [Duganella lactea]MYM80797.1 peptidase S53 [Duganella lactea]
MSKLPRHHVVLCIAALLSACGGGSDTASVTPQAAPLATAATILQLDDGALTPADATQFAQPSFHMAPLLLEAPAEAQTAVHTQTVPAAFRRLNTRRLTLESLRVAQANRLANVDTDTSSATPLASSTTVATYTPAQIRAAYGLPALPGSYTGLSATQAAQLGAGQTIYIVDAMHNPNVAAELSAFNSKFGLPACATKTIATTASLPLAAASASGCELSVVYSTASGGMSATAPAYDAGWATEIALDVQWAHATAPLARIVLIEAASASYDNLLGGVRLANRLGAGVVSMSFGGSETSTTSAADSVFSGANMTYLAATGDSGAGVAWPSVSPKVLAVGGTTLSYSGVGARSEVVWSNTGGGVSAYVATPAYQSGAVPGMGTAARRTVADVAFNADPSSGQYVAIIAAGSGTVKWSSVGGTSLATPQWAGLIAIANALRVVNGKAALAAPHAALYTNISTVAGTYASVFKDITSGRHGSCAACGGETGYDQATGLGTPNGGALLSALSGLTVQAAPVVTAATISGKAGAALSFTAPVTASNAVTYALTGAPSGMSISGAGVVTWATPVAGTYGVTITARDSVNGLSGSGVLTVVIAAAGSTSTSNTPTAPTASGGPIINASAMVGVANRALSGTIGISDATSKSVAVSLSGAPLGMTFQVSGMQITATWAAPKVGNYTLKVVATDSNGASATASIPVTVSAR